MSSEDALNSISGISSISIDTDLRNAYRAARASFSQTYYDDISGNFSFKQSQRENSEVVLGNDFVDKNDKTKELEVKTEEPEILIDESIENHIKKTDVPMYVYRPQLSGHKYTYACEAMREFFNESPIPAGKLAWLGNSSSDMRAHYIYKSRDGNIYWIFNYMGEWRQLDYFTRSDLLDFLGDSKNTPDWEESEFVKSRCLF